jgi:putative chitinase
MISAAQLLAIMPSAGAHASLYAAPLGTAADEQDINTPRRLAAFLAQVAQESGELRYVRELSSGQQYEGRKDLGNTEPGDGRRFLGRGLLQATGRAMYAELERALNLPLLANPGLLEQPVPAARSAAYIFAHSKQCNPLADRDEFGSICHRINGGYLGLDARITYWLRARRVLGV